ncbi:MAG: sulfur carrier protein ThiS [Syntrophobacteraceae bacterium]
MKLSINGKDTDYNGAPVLGELLRSLGIDSERVAVERNREIVSRAGMHSLRLEAGDELEIIRFVGGG